MEAAKRMIESDTSDPMQEKASLRVITRAIAREERRNERLARATAREERRNERMRRASENDVESMSPRRKISKLLDAVFLRRELGLVSESPDAEGTRTAAQAS
jgi:hypothetical protein